MPPAYLDCVSNYYEQLKKAGRLPYQLSEPTPSRLKKACIDVFCQRYDRKDEEALRNFFCYSIGAKLTPRMIENFDNDKFKPLVKFLRNPKIRTDRKNVELLAWLIDFPKRPYDYREDYTRPIPIPGESGAEPPAGREQPSTWRQQWWRFPAFHRAAFGIGMVTIILLVQYLITSNRLPEKCMYWATDHYEPISCNEHSGDALVIAFDAERFHSFKKINRPDTITRKSIGHVWYAKINKEEVQFFTGGGFHPENPNLRLKPITDYMIRKYVTHRMAVGE
jgi:hypothetical protein